MTENSGEKQVTRRDFLKLAGLLAAAMALPKDYVPRIAKALGAAARPPVIWLEFQDCTGDSESFLRAAPRVDPLRSGVNDPGLVDLLLDVISLDYHETLMAPAGAASEKSRADTIAQHAGEFIAIVEGSIPTAQNGVYCTIGGRTALSIAQEILPQAKAVIAAGTCALNGGLAHAKPNLTGAAGVKDAVPGLKNLVNLPGCPVNVVNLVATITYILAFDSLPERDSLNRPLFAYGDVVHEYCERRYHFEAGRFVQAWGDPGHKAGWCLYKMGCKGPATHNNCSRVKFNDETSWPVQSGHGCVGCAEPDFWDKFPVYKTGPGD